MKDDKNKSRFALRAFGRINRQPACAIVSAVQLSEATGTALRIVWFKDWGMGAEWREIFKPMKHYALREASLLDSLVCMTAPENGISLCRNCFRTCCSNSGLTSMMSRRSSVRTFDFCAWAKGRNSYMSCYRFSARWTTLLFRFVQSYRRNRATYRPAILNNLAMRQSAYMSAGRTTVRR